jgi:hypothetical protein
LQDLPGTLERAGDAKPLDDVAETVADQHRADLLQARQVAHRAERSLQHGGGYRNA